MEKQATYLKTLITGRKLLLRNLETSGFYTLEDCAQAGSHRLFKIKGFGTKALATIMRHCHTRKIPWHKEPAEIAIVLELKSTLQDRYELSGSDAMLIAEIFFQERLGLHEALF